MDHIVCLDNKTRELENLLEGNKSMIIRGAGEKKFPYGNVSKGDFLYFITNNGENEIKARGIVSCVLNFEKLTAEESFETIIRHQDKLQLPDEQFERLAGKSCLVLIGLNDIEVIKPIMLSDISFINADTLIPVGKIESITF
jgi:hypothetical protein